MSRIIPESIAAERRRPVMLTPHEAHLLRNLAGSTGIYDFSEVERQIIDRALEQLASIESEE